MLSNRRIEQKVFLKRKLDFMHCGRDELPVEWFDNRIGKFCGNYMTKCRPTLQIACEPLRTKGIVVIERYAGAISKVHAGSIKNLAAVR